MRFRQLPAVLPRALLVAVLLLVPGWRGPAGPDAGHPRAGLDAVADRGALGDAILPADRTTGAVGAGQARRDPPGRELPLLAVLAVLLGLAAGNRGSTGRPGPARRPRPVADGGTRVPRAPPALRTA